MLLKPRLSAHPSSRSIVGKSNVLACHISSWLMAVLGEKLQPTSQGCSRAQASAFGAGQGPISSATPALEGDVNRATARSPKANTLGTACLMANPTF